MSNKITAENVKEILTYDPQTGEFFWRNHTAKKAVKGRRAGSIAVNGYRTIRVFGRPYFEHRLAFLLMEGRWPAEQVDHVNCIRDDNRWENLRECNQTQNNFAGPTRKDNTSGERGVSRDNARNKWFAEVTCYGKRLRKRFDEYEDACLWVKETRLKEMGEFCS